MPPSSSSVVVARRSQRDQNYAQRRGTERVFFGQLRLIIQSEQTVKQIIDKMRASKSQIALKEPDLLHHEPEVAKWTCAFFPCTFLTTVPALIF